MVRKIAILGVLALAAGGLGCVNDRYVTLWDGHDSCVADPGSYEKVEPQAFAADEGGAPVPDGDPKTALRLEVSRRACLFHVSVTRQGITRTFGPYEYVGQHEIEVRAGHGRYWFAGRTGTLARVVVDGVEGPVLTIGSALFSSSNHEHVGYLSGNEEERSVWVDGKEVVRGKGLSMPVQLLAVLDDGRAAYAERTSDGRQRLTVGSWHSPPLDLYQGFQVWRGQRFGAFLQRGTQWEAVIDGRTEKMTGSPVTGMLVSPDGAHLGYAMYRGDLPERGYTFVLDGVEAPLRYDPSQASIRFIGGLAVQLRYEGNETGHHLIGVKTPSAQAARDKYTEEKAGKEGQFVQIGQSRGPQFRAILVDSLRVDEQGRVRYRATREDGEYEVIDNVILALPLGASPASMAPAKVAAPDPPPPATLKTGQ